MTYNSLHVDITDQIAHVRLNRPEQLNSLNGDFWREFPQAIHQIDHDAKARVIVLSSTGKHFCAGMDLDVFTSGSLLRDYELGRKQEDMRRMVMQLQAVFSSLEQVRMPVLAAIQGGCIGGAVDMISASDSRYCTRDAFFCIAETNLGMTADLGTLQRLPHLIPQGLARELAYTGRKLGADEALGCGLVNRVFDSHEEMLSGVMEIAHTIARQSPLAVSGCKEMLNYSRDHSVADSLRYMATWQSGMFQPQSDMRECFEAKAEQRQPQFDDLAPIQPPIS